MTNKKQKNRKTGKKRPKKTPKIKNRIFYVALASIVLFLGFSFYKYVYANSKKSTLFSAPVKEDKSTKILMAKMKHMLEVENKQVLKEIEASRKKIVVPEVLAHHPEKIEVKALDKNVTLKISQKSYLSEVRDFKKNSKKKEDNITSKKVVKYSGKPKLAIIIDDVAFTHELKRIKEIPYKVTPSFFPPTKTHPKTVALSKEVPVAMLHLPLEAIDYAHPEPKTLLVTDSKETIYNRIKLLKSKFPQIKYYNNHTGSKFTSNTLAMKRLINVMQSFKLHFVDSRTISKTKAKRIFKALHLRLLSRDIFLDNTPKTEDIVAQLKKAVKIAKKRGYAIAIGHPHKNTLKVLINAKKYLKDVELVYINEI